MERKCSLRMYFYNTQVLFYILLLKFSASKQSRCSQYEDGWCAQFLNSSPFYVHMIPSFYAGENHYYEKIIFYSNFSFSSIFL